MIQYAYSLSRYHVNASLVPRPSNGGDMERIKACMVLSACTCAVIIHSDFEYYM